MLRVLDRLIIPAGLGRGTDRARHSDGAQRADTRHGARNWLTVGYAAVEQLWHVGQQRTWCRAATGRRAAVLGASAGERSGGERGQGTGNRGREPATVTCSLLPITYGKKASGGKGVTPSTLTCSQRSSRRTSAAIAWIRRSPSRQRTVSPGRISTISGRMSAPLKSIEKPSRLKLSTGKPVYRRP